MQLDKTSHWMTIIGNLGLLVGVALVIFQINQNSELMREQLYHARWSDDLNLHLALMGENPSAAIAKAIENPSELTVEESRVLDAYITYWSLMETRKHFAHDRGLTIEAPSTYEPSHPRYALDMQVLGNPYTAAQVSQLGRAGPLLTEKLKPLLAELSGNESGELHRRTLRLIQAKLTD